jgi:hypothetical protein
MKFVVSLLPWAAIGLACDFAWDHDGWRMAGCILIAVLLNSLQDTLAQQQV